MPVISRARARLSGTAPMWLAVGAYLLVRAVIMLGGHLYADDYAIRYWADRSGLTPEYLFRSYGGHVQPFGLLIQWFAQRAAPGSWPLLVVCSLVLQAVALVILWRIMLRLTGSDLAALIAFLIPAVTMFGFETGVWWIEVAEAAPYAVFILLAVYLLIRALQGEPGRWWLWSFLAFCAALISISKGMLGALVLFTVAAGVAVGSGRRRGVIGALKAAPKYWAGVAVVAVAWTAFLSVHARISRDPDWQLVRALRYARDLFMFNVVPAIVGGPWTWFSAPGERWRGLLVIPWPSPLLAFASVIVLVALISYVVLLRRSLLLYLGLLGLYAGIVVGLAAYGRGGGVIASSGYRYTFDFWVPLSIFMGLLFFPTVWEQQPFTTRAAAVRERLATMGWTRSTVAVACAVALVVSASISTFEPALRFINSGGKDYIHRAIATRDRVPEGVAIIPQMTPMDLVHPLLMLPFASTEVVFSPVGGFPEFDQTATDGLFGFDREGNLQAQSVVGVASVPPEQPCGYRPGDGTVTIPFETPVQPWVFMAEVSYYSAEDGSAEMMIGQRPVTVPIRAGIHRVYFYVAGPADAAQVQVVTGARDLCVDRIVVGPRAGPDGQPVFPPPELPATP